MSPQPDLYDAVATALRDLTVHLGRDAFADRRRLISLLSDRLPEARREIRLVGSAIDEGVPAALAAAERHLVGMEMDRQASRLEAGTGLRVDLAKSIVRAFAFALDLGPLPSDYQDWTVTPAPAPAPAPTPAGPDGDWAGISALVDGPAPPYPVAPPAPVDHRFTGYPVPPPPGPAPATRGFRLEQKHLLLIAVAVAGLAGVSQFMPAGEGVQKNEPVVPDTRQSERNFAGELDNLGVPPKTVLESNVGSPTPLEIAAGTRISTDALQALISRDSSALLIDVLDNPHPNTIRNAAYLPAAGKGGTFDDAHQATTAAELKRLVASKPARPLVFFCMGAACWESYNAVLRANAAGYRNLFWYRGGLASWTAAGLPMQPLSAPPATGAAGIF